MDKKYIPKMENIEKEYKEWCVNLLKVRFDLKPEYYDDHQHNNFTYENCADCLWNNIKDELAYLHYLRYSLGDDNEGNDVDSPEEIKENRDTIVNILSEVIDENVKIKNDADNYKQNFMKELKINYKLEDDLSALKKENEGLKNQIKSLSELLKNYRKETTIKDIKYISVLSPETLKFNIINQLQNSKKCEEKEKAIKNLLDNSIIRYEGV